MALLLFIAPIAEHPKTMAPVQTTPEPFQLPVTEPPESKADADVVNLLSIFQERRAWSTSLMDDIAGYSDRSARPGGSCMKGAERLS